MDLLSCGVVKWWMCVCLYMYNRCYVELWSCVGVVLWSCGVVML